MIKTKGIPPVQGEAIKTNVGLGLILRCFRKIFAKWFEKAEAEERWHVGSEVCAPTYFWHLVDWSIFGEGERELMWLHLNLLGPCAVTELCSWI